MFVDLPNLWIVLLNVTGIPAIHFGVSWFYTRLRTERFDPGSRLFRERPFEKGGHFYQRLFRIRQWKGLLPDAAPWFDGFAKGSLKDRSPTYLRAFITETCRGEAAHYAQILALLLTLAWNPWPVAAFVIVFYAFASNLPCLLLQRFTRARLRHLLKEIEIPRNPGQ